VHYHKENYIYSYIMIPQFYSKMSRIKKEPSHVTRGVSVFMSINLITFACSVIHGSWLE